MPPRRRSKRKTEVPDEVKRRLLTWCGRHCCWCEKACGQKIEIHHIDGNHENHDEENLCPVCFDDHAELSSYNAAHPRGLKYRPEEIRRRRDEVYETQTRRYLPEGVKLHVTNYLHLPLMLGQQIRRPPGDVSCAAFNPDPDRPCRLRVLLVPYSRGVRIEENVGDPCTSERRSGISDLNAACSDTSVSKPPKRSRILTCASTCCGPSSTRLIGSTEWSR